MAHIVYRTNPDQNGAMQLLINGVDYSAEVYPDIQIVSVGDDPRHAEVGVQVTFSLSRLDLGGDTDVVVTDRLPEVAQRVQSMTGIAAQNVVLKQSLVVLHRQEKAIERLEQELKSHPDRIGRAVNKGVDKKRAAKR